MTPEAAPLLEDLLARAERAKRDNDWRAIADLARHVPEQLDAGSARLADEVAFALGQLGRHREAIAFLERSWAVEPTWRRASALAYQHYDAAMANGRKTPPDAEPLDRESAREGFRCWIARALELQPGSVKDLYRLGVFEAQVESRRDKPALRAFLAAIEAYRALPELARERRGDLAKIYVKAR